MLSVLKNGRVIDVFCGKIIKADVAILDGRIVGVGDYHSENQIDVSGKYIMPGFIDSHVHIESSMLTPDQYADLVLPKGVTTLIADPHEIANVCGLSGIKFMIESAKNTMLKIKFMAPSCVPATSFERSGSVLNADELRLLFDENEVLGLGEMMNFFGVISQEEDVMQKLSLCALVDGHAPELSGANLDKYISKGIKTDHECASAEEMREKIQKGMYVLIREGSLGKNLTLVSAVNSKMLRRCCFCSDDRSTDDIINYGTINFCVKKAVELGMSELDAITIATLNAAECYNLSHHGAIAPGYYADILVSNDLEAQNIDMVYINGEIVVKNGLLLNSHKINKSEKFLDAVTNTVILPNLSKDMLSMKIKNNMPVIQVQNNSIATKKVMRSPKESGEFLLDENGNRLSRIAVIQRYGLGNIGMGIVENYDIKNGAIASTIGHDSHNLIVIGDNVDDMLIAAYSLNGGGGISVVSKGKMICNLKLPIAGIMTASLAQDVKADLNNLRQAAKILGINSQIDPFMALSFLPLPVIPELRITCDGVFDVSQWKFI